MMWLSGYSRGTPLLYSISESIPVVDMQFTAAGFIHPVEAFKKPVVMFRSNADTVIFDRQNCIGTELLQLPRAAQPDRDLHF